MRRRNIAIAIGVAMVLAVLAFAFLLLRAQATGFDVRVVGQTTDGAVSYVLLATNSTHRPHGFTAWSESSSDGVTWQHMKPYEHGTTVQPGKSETFTLLRSLDGNRRRIRVSCFPLNTREWQHWRDGLKALLGVPWSQSYRVYIEVE